MEQSLLRLDSKATALAASIGSTQSADSRKVRMKVQQIKTGLWFHTLITILIGFSLFLFPKIFGPLWPWALPPLAARFMGSLLIGGGVCTALAALAPEPLPVTGPALLGLGDLLIASVGLLDIGEIGFTRRMIIWLVIFIGTASLLWALFLLYNHQASRGNDGQPPTPGLRIYFTIHIAGFLPGWLTMFPSPTLSHQPS